MSRRISSPQLIGRAAEVAALGAALADAQRGRGRLVLVEGDAGIGKTRLVEDFTAQADRARVLAGGGIPLASDTPYAPVLGILQALARLHPAAAGGLLPQEAPGRADPFGPTRLLAAAADAVRAVAAQTPLVLVVEDLHWADASTRGLVSFLARAVRENPVLLLVTVRAEELDPARPVSVLIGELARLPHAERLVLAPLEHAEVAALVEAITGVAPSARLTGQLVQRAAGNPFFTEELLAAGRTPSRCPRRSVTCWPRGQRSSRQQDSGCWVRPRCWAVRCLTGYWPRWRSRRIWTMGWLRQSVTGCWNPATMDTGSGIR